MSDHPKIHERHRQRWAYVYIRQSTLRQVAEHQESQDLQYQCQITPTNVPGINSHNDPPYHTQDVPPVYSFCDTFDDASSAN